MQNDRRTQADRKIVDIIRDIALLRVRRLDTSTSAKVLMRGLLDTLCAERKYQNNTSRSYEMAS